MSKKKEEWKTKSEELERNFYATLKHIWNMWDSYVEKGTPFGDLGDIVETDIESDSLRQFSYDVGWARGVSESTGWPLTRPGPREWSPRD